MEQKYLEVEAEKYFEKNRLWFRRFQTTRSFRKLIKPERAAAGYITQAFVGLAYKYQLRGPRQYSAKSVKEVILNLFPSKIAATNVFFTSVIPVMRRYFVFLGVQHKISNAKTLVRALDGIKIGTLLSKHRDMKNWDQNKRRAMQVLMGYKLDASPERIAAYEEDYNMGVPLRFCFDFSVNRPPKNIILLTFKCQIKLEILAAHQ